MHSNMEVMQTLEKQFQNFVIDDKETHSST